MIDIQYSCILNFIEYLMKKLTYFSLKKLVEK